MWQLILLGFIVFFMHHPKGSHTRKIVHMPADGNCQFHGLAYPDLNHVTVREAIVQHMEKEWDRYKPFLDEDELNTYLQSMSQHGAWGDELTLQAFCEAYDRSVRVFSARTGRRINSYGNSPRVKDLLYDGVHYDVLESERRWRSLATLFP